MGYFTNEIITDAGNAMFADSVANNSEVVFTRIEVGDGAYSISEIASLRQAVSIKNAKASFDVTGISSQEECIRIRTVITNTDVEDGYYAREIGVYATGNDGAEKLVAISICTEETATYIPRYQDRPIEIPLTDYIAYSGDGNFSIRYESAAYVPLDEFEELKKKVVQSDFEEDDESSPAFIKNKPKKLSDFVNDIRNVITGTLKSGDTSLTLSSDTTISSDSLIDVYADVYGVSPKSVTVSGKNIMLTFKAQSSDVQVKVVIS